MFRNIEISPFKDEVEKCRNDNVESYLHQLRKSGIIIDKVDELQIQFLIYDEIFKNYRWCNVKKEKINKFIKIINNTSTHTFSFDERFSDNYFL